MIHEQAAGGPRTPADESRPQSRAFSKPPKCPNCGKRALMNGAADYSTRAKYDGRPYELHLEKLPALVCSECNEHVFGVDADDLIQDALRAKVGVLSPKEIRDERTSLGLTQSELAEALGIAETSVSRWESRAVIQSKSMDRFLRVFFRFSEVREYLSPKTAETPATPSVARPDSLPDDIGKWMKDPMSPDKAGKAIGRLAHHFGEEIAPEVQSALRALDRERSTFILTGVLRSVWAAPAAGDLPGAKASKQALPAAGEVRALIESVVASSGLSPASEPGLSPSLAIARIARFFEASLSRLEDAGSYPRK
ncbi:MAG: type II toxin-antitoxin system MqsA family antitoxin [Planctomycetes bacterium]|nr:type II toxin-antitoxin system MqsA family antitoxin [Planctomycetota bacterium]